MKNIFNIILSAAIGILLLTTFNQCQRANAAEQDAKSLWESHTEMAITFRDKEGRLNSEIKAATIGNQKLLNDIAEKELNIKNLKGKVQSLTTINRLLSLNDTVSTDSIIYTPGDTIVKDSMVYVYPTYTYSESTKWFDISLEMNRLITKYSINMNDSISIVHKTRNRLFKPTEYTAMAISENPLVTSQDITYYTFREDPKRWSLGIQAGYGLVDPRELKLSPFIGVGLQYSIIRW